MPINFYTPTFRQQVNPIDLNVLARTYNTLEQGHQQAIQTKSQIDAQLAQLDLNEAEDAWRQEHLIKFVMLLLKICNMVMAILVLMI